MLLFYLSLIDSEEDRNFFENMYLTYKNDMFRLARALLKNEADAEDAVGDVFVKVASKHMPFVTGITNERDLENYLLKATKNTALNMLAQFSRQNTSLDSITENHISSMPELSDASFFDTILTKIECDRVINAINNLNETYKYIMYDHFVLGDSLSTIASNSGKSFSTIKKQLQRGKQLIIASLEHKTGGSQ